MAAVAPFEIGPVVRGLETTLRPGVSMRRAAGLEHGRREFLHYGDLVAYRPQAGRK